MSKIVITCAMTVDGLIESPAPRPYGWLVLEGQSEQAQFDVFRDAAGMLLGRKNYEGFASYWPTAAGDGRWADRLNPMRKWVASTTLREPLEWNATLLEGDVVEQIRQLKSDLDGDLVSSGLGRFAHFLVEHDLVDELLLFVNPSIQGAGDRPFHGASVDLELLEARSFDSGVALLRYRPSGTGKPPMTSEASPTSEVVVVRELDAPPEVAWRAWTDPEQVRQWWGPIGFVCPRADVDFRVGGTTLVTMQAPAEYGGFSVHNRWTYTAVAEPNRIEFVSTFSDADGNPIDPAAAGIPAGVPAEVPHVVTLEPLPGGRTKITVTEFGYTDDEAREQSQQGQEQCLDKMQALYAATT
jgi:uncharacterized protein YndB with AHSA1/START domain/dihydrofolate reductase